MIHARARLNATYVNSFRKRTAGTRDNRTTDHGTTGFRVFGVFRGWRKDRWQPRTTRNTRKKNGFSENHSHWLYPLVAVPLKLKVGRAVLSPPYPTKTLGEEAAR